MSLKRRWKQTRMLPAPSQGRDPQLAQLVARQQQRAEDQRLLRERVKDGQPGRRGAR